ncbi:putative O-methyltransferase YrrM [Lachnotalea glycerini]|uniref:tRNA 5-hydroxyuridine methyltransferase n=1 Tax=Lachnotalea glycerini TaxID=1763509 RepID=A0A318EPT8_9FIRM|nr:O-methyltransferase [Lachnotalea glycerini]PXV93491.1 putative O-methyltransferase YrrM [Lachnotalea glycerini]
MIVDDRMKAYINSLDSGNTPLLDRIEEEALEEFIPIIRKETQNLLKVLLKIKQPLNILEVGTAIGFSAILMGEYSSKACKITTIEKYHKRIPIAKANFIRANMQDKIKLLEGDALEIMSSLNEQYDFIFMDAAKAQYINFLPQIRRLLIDDGVLISDNVMQDGDIVESRYAVIRRNRTIHSRMRDYLYELTHARDFITTVLPIGDGVTISVFKRK